MRHAASRIVIVGALIGLGWAIGRAQTSAPDFELVVNAPAGETTVECKRGCDLLWVERGINPDAARMTRFSFRCSGPAVERCSSATIGGWIKP